VGFLFGYEYSLDNVTYQPSNIFTVNTAGTYTVYIKQMGVTTNPCITGTKCFNSIKTLLFKITTQPLCNGGLGSIRLVADDVPQYFSIINGGGGTLVEAY
jgi:hypothetical protein